MNFKVSVSPCFLFYFGGILYYKVDVTWILYKIFSRLKLINLYSIGVRGCLWKWTFILPRIIPAGYLCSTQFSSRVIIYPFAWLDWKIFTTCLGLSHILVDHLKFIHLRWTIDVRMFLFDFTAAWALYAKGMLEIWDWWNVITILLCHFGLKCDIYGDFLFLIQWIKRKTFVIMKESSSDQNTWSNTYTHNISLVLHLN